MIKGRVWKYGDSVNTDLIFPGRFTYVLMSEDEMGAHALEDLDETFTRQGQPGDVIVAGTNWGCGSAREQAVKALKARGVAAIVAKSFARIYFRNSLNEGLPVIACPGAADAAQAGESIEIDLENHCVITAKGTFPFGEYHPYIQKMVDCGGLMNYVKETLRQQGKLKETDRRNP